MRWKFSRVVVSLSMLILPTFAASGDPPSSRGCAAIDYARQIKPILTRHCVSMSRGGQTPSGPQARHRRGGDPRGQSRPHSPPGHGEESPLILALRGEGAGERMPLNRPPLSEAEIILLQNWIDQGAKGIAWRTAGSAARGDPLGVPASPATGSARCAVGERSEQSDRPLHPGSAGTVRADSFAGGRSGHLAAPGEPRPDRPAARPVERDAFLADRSPDRYERLVDRLLARLISASDGRAPGSTRRVTPIPTATTSTPRARSGNTATGSSPPSTPTCRSTSSRSTRSPATSSPGASFAQRIATGFHRNTQINQEGGIDVEQFRVEAVVDRVNTTGTVFLGLTIGCAQCHDHKYDPIRQREYYRLFAFFNNVDEPELEIAAPAELASRRARSARRIDGSTASWPRAIRISTSANGGGRRPLALAFTQAQAADVRVAFDTAAGEADAHADGGRWSS